MILRKTATALLLAALFSPNVAFAQTGTGVAPATQVAATTKVFVPGADITARIKEEGTSRSQVMQTLRYLTDVIGPRLTNSPGMKRANEWTRDEMKRFGLQNAKLEAWGPFGRGWTLKSYSAQVVEPQAIPVIGYPKAWSPSTKGVVTAEVVHLNARTEGDLERYKGQLRGKIVLVSPPRELKGNFEPFGLRYNAEKLTELAKAPDPTANPRNALGITPERIQQIVQGAQYAAKRANFVIAEGAAVLVDNSYAGSGGAVFVAGASVAQAVPANITEVFAGRNRLQPYNKDAEAKMLPQLTLAAEHYNRLVRLLEAGEKVRMSVDIQAQYNDDDPMGYNTVAEIPGTDPTLKEEVVMLGGHLDSWHAGTGATDNAAGCAVAMEAARIIQTLGLKPRRTIRVALWSGEEQGLHGSRAYVARHFGQRGDGSTSAMMSAMMGEAQPALNKKPEYEKLSAYYNLDNGTGKIRGVYMQGNSAVAPIFRQWLEPFKEMGAETLTISNTGGTDHLSFDQIGLPGFQFIQDEIEYDALTHHSNQDVYDRLQVDDMKQASIVMAAFVYNTAMMDEKLPRKPVN